MATITFYADQSAPHGMFGSKMVAGDETWALWRTIATGDLGGKGQEEFVQTLFAEEASNQVRPSLNQDRFARAHSANCLENGRSTDTHFT